MSNYVVDLANNDDAELLNLTNHDNAATIVTNLNTSSVDVSNLTALTQEPIDRQIFVEELADTTGYNVLGRTVYNSDYSASAMLGIPYGDLVAHLVREVIYGNTFEDVWTQWNRISHLETTENQPAKPSELNSWTYDADKDSVVCTINSASFIGFVSNYKITTDYKFDTIVGSIDSDNDSVVVILGYVLDDQGKEHTLCAVRSASTEGHLKVTGKFDIWYNYKQSSAKLIASGGGTASESGGWGSKYSRVTATKTGNKYVVTCTEFSKDATEAAHGPTKVEVSHRFDLGDHAELDKFVNGAGFGYGSVSQNKSTFINILRPDQKEASAFKEVFTYVHAMGGTKYYRMAYLDKVTEEGEDTAGYTLDDTPSRSHLATLTNKAYVGDKVDVRFNRINTTDVMEMTEALNDFDWYKPAKDDAMADAPFAVVRTPAGGAKWGSFDWIAPTVTFGELDAKFFVRKHAFFEGGTYKFRVFADDAPYLWIDDKAYGVRDGANLTVDIDIPRGWHTVTGMCHDSYGGAAYIGVTAEKTDGTIVLKTDTSWKCIVADDTNKYGESNLPEVGVYHEDQKADALQAFADAALRDGIDVTKVLKNLVVEFVDENEGGKPVTYLQFTFDSYVLNDGVAAKFRLPKHFSEIITVKLLKGFGYTPIKAADVVA